MPHLRTNQFLAIQRDLPLMRYLAREVLASSRPLATRDAGGASYSIKDRYLRTSGNVSLEPTGAWSSRGHLESRTPTGIWRDHLESRPTCPLTAMPQGAETTPSNVDRIESNSAL
ncbi:hypothetical protein Lfu02_76080 [Longispora fulva]|nr:hypothetical protein Lfu02_76080 [Longispora fulva]